MAKRKSRTIPRKVTRYYLSFHHTNGLSYELDQTFFRTYQQAAQELPSHIASCDQYGPSPGQFLVAKVTIEPATVPQRKATRKAA